MVRVDEVSEGESLVFVRFEDIFLVFFLFFVWDCGVLGFYVDVVVMGVVDECIFFGKDGIKNVKEEIVCLMVSLEELLFLG